VLLPSPFPSVPQSSDPVDGTLTGKIAWGNDGGIIEKCVANISLVQSKSRGKMGGKIKSSE
jgi:hypothetical protein